MIITRSASGVVTVNNGQFRVLLSEEVCLAIRELAESSRVGAVELPGGAMLGLAAVVPGEVPHVG
jgi:hypothetical protein